jgi:hypothetical protein
MEIKIRARREDRLNHDEKLNQADESRDRVSQNVPEERKGTCNWLIFSEKIGHPKKIVLELPALGTSNSSERAHIHMPTFLGECRRNSPIDHFPPFRLAPPSSVKVYDMPLLPCILLLLPPSHRPTIASLPTTCNGNLLPSRARGEHLQGGRLAARTWTGTNQ